MERISGDFVRSLRKKIDDKKRVTKYERNLLQDSLNFILSILLESDQVELRTVKNFETLELSCVANLYSESDNIFETLSETLRKFFPEQKMHFLDKNISLVVLDLKDKLIGYRNKKNEVIVQFSMRGKHSFEMKIFRKNLDPFSSIYEKNYFHIKFWVNYKSNIFCYQLNLTNEMRESDEVVLPISDNLRARIIFNEIGEPKELNISKIKGRKKQKSTISINK